MPRRNDSIDWLRRDWYGMERGRSEIAARQPAPVPIAEALDQVVRSILPKSMVILGKVCSAWPEIAGAENARRTEPLFLKDGILFVEISHPAYRMALDTPRVRKLLLERLQERFGASFCSGLRFVPAGRRER